MKSASAMTLGEMMISCTQELKSVGIENAGREMEILLTSVLGESRTDLYYDRNKLLSESNCLMVKEYSKRRRTGEPIQYIVGDTEFFSLQFKTDKRALIPRPETEILVEKAIELLRGMDNPAVLDIGTGSGAIAAAVAANCDCRVTAIDCSEEALELAGENCQLNNVDKKVDLIKFDFLSENFSNHYDAKFDLVVSNPPYVSLGEVSSLDANIKDFEPMIALTDNADGLTFYRRIAELTTNICKPGGWVLLEIADNRGTEVMEIMQSKLTSLKIFPDLTGRDRVIAGQCSSY